MNNALPGVVVAAIAADLSRVKRSITPLSIARTTVCAEPPR
jgi:hypothetical protein